MLWVWRVLTHLCALGSSPLTAFAFHQTAYKERLEEVKCGLRVIEKLRAYKPRTRHHNRSSAGHGVFNLGFIHPFGEKDSNHRRGGNSVSQCYDGANDADTEDNKAKGKQKSVGSRASIQLHEIPPDSPDLENSRTLTSPPAFNLSDEKQNGYPPSRKRTVDQHVPQQEEHNPAILAARAIKSAVLHDARNIKGDDDDLSELKFSVNSAHEAKV